jgi:cellulose synthase/poly-beta-1,6-N-acetylglucosamine synthase-like glycosyltransferase
LRLVAYRLFYVPAKTIMVQTLRMAPALVAFGKALTAASPRLTPRASPAIVVAIYGGVLALSLAVFARAFQVDSIFTWSVGIAYILYDSALMMLVLCITSPDRRVLDVAVPGQTCTLGVVVAAHNEAHVLRRTLDALLAQTARPDIIIVADDGSDDDTSAVLQSYGLEAPEAGQLSGPASSEPSLRWLRLHHMGKPSALNAALGHLQIDVVITIDADTLPEPQAFAAVKSAFAGEPQLVAAGGVLMPVCASGGADHRIMEFFQRYEYMRNFLARFAWSRMNGLVLISGAFAAYRRDALVKIGGFDVRSLVEDYEVTHRLHRYAHDHCLNWTLRMIGAAHASTEAPGTIPAFLRQRRRWFAGFLQTQYWNRDMTGNARFGRLGTTMMLIKALDTVQPIYGLTALALLAVLLVIGQFEIAGAVFAAIGLKLAIDFLFQIWTVRIYRRLTGTARNTTLPHAIFAAAIEPFSFQVLRHLGATWGWLAFFTGTSRWTSTDRSVSASE